MYIMEGMMKREICVTKNGHGGTNASALSVHNSSQIITKVKPKIRIIHIFAPEIIKTDVANFRELVQRLTGKPAENIKKKTSSHKNSKKKKKMDLIRGGIMHHDHEKIKGQEEIWRGANSGGDFLGGFGDELEGFMEQLNYNNHDHFPLMIPMAMDASSHHHHHHHHHHMDVYAAAAVARSQIA